MRLTRTGPAGGLLEGWRLVGVVGAVVAVAAIGLALAAGGGIDGVRLAIRITARTSIALFLLAFTASSLAALLPTPFTAWQLRNRRYLGVSFAVSHLVHAGAIVFLLRWDSALFWTLTNPVNIGTGGLAYAFILAMAATSFDRTAAWLGPGRWRVLHRLGVWYIWVSFLIAFVKRIPENGAAYWLPVVALLAALALRLAAGRRRRSGPQPA